MISESPIAPVLRKAQYYNKPSLKLSLKMIVSFTEKNRQDGEKLARQLRRPGHTPVPLALADSTHPSPWRTTLIPGMNDSALAIIYNIFFKSWGLVAPKVGGIPRYDPDETSVSTRRRGNDVRMTRSWCTYTKSPPSKTTHRLSRVDSPHMCIT